MLRLQNYNLNVVYTKGSTLYLADTLSRAYFPLDERIESINALEAVDHTEALPVSHCTSRPNLESKRNRHSGEETSRNDPVRLDKQERRQ